MTYEALPLMEGSIIYKNIIKSRVFRYLQSDRKFRVPEPLRQDPRRDPLMRVQMSLFQPRCDPIGLL